MIRSTEKNMPPLMKATSIVLNIIHVDLMGKWPVVAKMHLPIIHGFVNEVNYLYLQVLNITNLLKVQSVK